jgi:hypothetical protein
VEKLKLVIEQYGRWAPMSEYVQRINTFKDTDVSIAVENSKALLESISKNICKEKGQSLKGDESINKLVKIAFTAIGYPAGQYMNVIGSSLSSIAHQIGNLRTELGITSHGKTFEELGKRNNNLDQMTRDYLIETTEIVDCFLIRHFENENPRVETAGEEAENQIEYSDCEDFNDYWDGEYGEFFMGEYSFFASEVLYDMDKEAYKYEYEAFNNEADIEPD